MQRMKVGACSVTALLDGEVRLPPEMLFPDIREDEWAPFRPGYVGADGLLPLSLGAFLIASRGEYALVDTGVGLAAESFGLPTGGIARDLDALGVRCEDVGLVILTHMHADHIGGSTIKAEGGFKPRYPNARYLIDREEWEYWVESGAGRDDPSLTPDLVTACAKPLRDSGQLVLTVGEHAPARHISVLPARGHTPGHCSVHVHDAGDDLMIVGDCAHCPAQVMNPNWSIYAGVDKDEERRSRDRVLDTIENGAMIMAAGHYFGANFGRLIRRDGKRVFEPLAADLQEAPA